jgi:hypothetical protein
MDLGSARVPAAAPAVRRNASLPAQGYRLSMRPDGVQIDAADDAGEAYARSTLAQLGAELPGGVIEDWPDLPVRGVMLDVSRDKVPTLATLEALIDRLASWKINQVQLYVEHTFAYRDHGVVWAQADPYTAEEIRRLDAFCRERHVELVPNQNCLGHWERWLKHEPYRRLAVSPDGWTDNRGRLREPTTLDPSNPSSLAIVRSLLAELLPNFGSRRVNVGLDEPWELRESRMQDYLEYVLRLRDAPELDGYEMLMWGDIVANHPEWITKLADGVTILEWGYEASHPYEARCSALAAGSRPFWVCPGTSSWNSLLGRTTNARGNLSSAAGAALAHGAAGYLITDWGDNGHLQYVPASEPGFAYGAAVSWCLDSNRDIDLAEALDAHAFADASGELGRALLDLGDVHTLVVPQVPNMSILAMHLYWPQLRLGEGFTEGLTAEDLLAVEAAVSDALARVRRSAPGRGDATLVKDELAHSCRLVALLCRDARYRLEAGRTLDSVPPARRGELASELAEIMDAHRELWLARNRPGGLPDSLARLERLRNAYLAP